jgi:cytoskeletal protein RodZ
MPHINTLLREARESKGFTIKEAAKVLKLRERHIQMLEDGRMKNLYKLAKYR